MAYFELIITFLNTRLLIWLIKLGEEMEPQQTNNTITNPAKKIIDKKLVFIEELN